MTAVEAESCFRMFLSVPRAIGKDARDAGIITAAVVSQRRFRRSPKQRPGCIFLVAFAGCFWSLDLCLRLAAAAGKKRQKNDTNLSHQEVTFLRLEKNPYIYICEDMYWCIGILVYRKIGISIRACSHANNTYIGTLVYRYVLVGMPMYRCTDDVPTYRWTNVPIYRRTDAPMCG